MIDKNHVFSEKMWTKVYTVRAETLFMKNIYYEKIVEKIVIFFQSMMYIKPSFFEKIATLTFFGNVCR